VDGTVQNQVALDVDEQRLAGLGDKSPGAGDSEIVEVHASRIASRDRRDLGGSGDVAVAEAGIPTKEGPNRDRSAASASDGVS
jgi:hypothetical protein